MPGKQWRIRLGDEAARDFVNILRYTKKTFGIRQREIYEETLNAALAALTDGPLIKGSVARDQIRPTIRTLHVARAGLRGSHVIVYRATEDQIIHFVRILHQTMNLDRHLPPEAE